MLSLLKGERRAETPCIRTPIRARPELSPLRETLPLVSELLLSESGPQRSSHPDDQDPSA